MSCILHFTLPQDRLLDLIVGLRRKGFGFGFGVRAVGVSHKTLMPKPGPKAQTEAIAPEPSELEHRNHDKKVFSSRNWGFSGIRVPIPNPKKFKGIADFELRERQAVVSKSPLSNHQGLSPRRSGASSSTLRPEDGEGLTDLFYCQAVLVQRKQARCILYE